MIWQGMAGSGGEIDPERELELRLVAQARKGAAWALSALVARYQPAVVRYLVRLTGNGDLARALAEQVFVHMAKRLRGPHGGDHLRLWLLRSATEVGLDVLRHPNRPLPPRLAAPPGPAALLPGQAAQSGVGRLLAAFGARVRASMAPRPTPRTQQFVWQSPAEPAAEDDVLPDVEGDTGELLTPREALRHRLVRAVLAELPYGDAQCLALHLVAGLNQNEVGQALGVVPQVAQRHMVQGLQLFGRRYAAALASLGLPEDLGAEEEPVREPEQAALAELAAYAPSAGRASYPTPAMLDHDETTAAVVARGGGSGGDAGEGDAGQGATWRTPDVVQESVAVEAVPPAHVEGDATPEEGALIVLAGTALGGEGNPVADVTPAIAAEQSVAEPVDDGLEAVATAPVAIAPVEAEVAEPEVAELAAEDDVQAAGTEGAGPEVAEHVAAEEPLAAELSAQPYAAEQRVVDAVPALAEPFVAEPEAADEPLAAEIVAADVAAPQDEVRSAAPDEVPGPTPPRVVPVLAATRPAMDAMDVEPADVVTAIEALPAAGADMGEDDAETVADEAMAASERTLVDVPRLPRIVPVVSLRAHAAQAAEAEPAATSETEILAAAEPLADEQVLGVEEQFAAATIAARPEETAETVTNGTATNGTATDDAMAAEDVTLEEPTPGESMPSEIPEVTPPRIVPVHARAAIASGPQAVPLRTSAPVASEPRVVPVLTRAVGEVAVATPPAVDEAATRAADDTGTETTMSGATPAIEPADNSRRERATEVGTAPADGETITGAAAASQEQAVTAVPSVVEQSPDAAAASVGGADDVVLVVDAEPYGQGTSVPWASQGPLARPWRPSAPNGDDAENPAEDGEIWTDR